MSCNEGLDIGGVEKSPLDMLIDLGLVEEIVPAVDNDVNITNELFVEIVSVEESEPAQKNIKKGLKDKVSSCKTISGYACFVQSGKAELRKINPSSKLNMVLLNDKWKKELSDVERKLFKDIATGYKHSYSKPLTKKDVKEVIKVKKLPKVKVKKVPVNDVHTNRMFVDEYENIDLEVEELYDRNKKLLELICERKLSVLKHSHEIELKISSETKCKSRFKTLSKLHDKCH